MECRFQVTIISAPPSDESPMCQQPPVERTIESPMASPRPAPDPCSVARRRSALTWSQFLRSQAEAILACDFFTADLLDGTEAYVLAVIEHATRRIRILAVTLHPTGEWTAQQAPAIRMARNPGPSLPGTKPRPAALSEIVTDVSP